MEEKLKQAWQSLDCIDNKTTEEIARIFFELGWKAGVENVHSSIAAAISVFNNLKVS